MQGLPSGSSHSSASALGKAASKWGEPIEGEIIEGDLVEGVLRIHEFVSKWKVKQIFVPTQHSSKTESMMHRTESEKPMSYGGIATWKVFARPESFCACL